MSKKRIIIPNTKVDKNNIGKQGLRFDEIYADNIIVDKINNKKVDPDYYLKDNFCIIYPNGGSKEAPANITVNTRYILDNPFENCYVDCKAEILIGGKWTTQKYEAFFNGSAYYASGFICEQYGDTIILLTGNHYLTLDNKNPYKNTVYPIIHDVATSPTTAPARIKIWKVGKIK